MEQRRRQQQAELQDNVPLSFKRIARGHEAAILLCHFLLICYSVSVRPSVRFLADPAPCSCRKRTVAAYTLYTLLTDTLLLPHLHLKKERTKKEDPLNPDGTHDFLIIPLTGLFSLEPSPSPHETQQQQSETRSRERKKDLNPIPNA